MTRGRSVEPELVSGDVYRPAGQAAVPRRQMRARSAGPNSRSSRYMTDADRSTLPRSDNRAMINQHVNPYQEFPSLRRGFTLEGMPILEKDETTGGGVGDACAYYFWAIALFFFTLAFINFIVLVAIMGVLRIGPTGMDSIEFLPALGSVKFLKDLVAPSITVGSGIISGYAGEPLTIKADDGDILFNIRGHSSSSPQLRISPQEISLTNVDQFRIVHPNTGRVYFDAQAPEFGLDEAVESLEVPVVETNNLVSPIDKDLLIKSDSGLELMGAEGVKVEAKSVEMEAGEDMHLTSSSGDLILDGSVTIDPLALPVGGGGYPAEKKQYKVCICGRSGKLFTVPVHKRTQDGSACLKTHWEKHPCADD